MREKKGRWYSPATIIKKRASQSKKEKKNKKIRTFHYKVMVVSVLIDEDVCGLSRKEKKNVRREQGRNEKNALPLCLCELYRLPKELRVCLLRCRSKKTSWIKSRTQLTGH